MTEYENQVFAPRRKLDDELWKDRGNCHGSDAESFFLTPEMPELIPTLTLICKNCPVKWTCLAYAIKYDEAYGWWGGATRGRRREIAVILRKTGLVLSTMPLNALAHTLTNYLKTEVRPFNRGRFTKENQ